MINMQRHFLHQFIVRENHRTRLGKVPSHTLKQYGTMLILMYMKYTAHNKEYACNFYQFIAIQLKGHITYNCNFFYRSTL